MRVAATLAVLLSLTFTAGAAAALCERVFDGPVWARVPDTRSAQAHAILDVTGDGRSDIVIGGSRLQFLPAVGPAGSTFGPSITVDVARDYAYFGSLAAADIDADGDRDVIAYQHHRREATGRVVQVYTNVRGTLRPAVDFLVVSAEGGQVFAGDFNGDGRSDFVFAGKDQTAVRFFAGAGNGTFSESPVAIGTQPFNGSGAAGDLDGDGITDLALSGPQTITLLFGGAAGFRPAVEVATGIAAHVTIIDVDGNGSPDVAYQLYSDFSSRTIGVITDVRAAAPRAAYRLLPLPMFEFAELVFGDINGDGRADVIASRQRSGVRVYEAAPDGTYVRRPDVLAFDPYYHGTGDVDGDGDTDVVTVGMDVLAVLVNRDGALQSPATYVSGNARSASAVADFNRDGRDDVLVDTQAWLSERDGTFTRVSGPTNIAVGGDPLIGDLNADGHFDFVYLFGSVQVATVVGLGRGDGTFDVRTASATGRQLERQAPLLIDIDLDGASIWPRTHARTCRTPRTNSASPRATATERSARGGTPSCIR